MGEKHYGRYKRKPKNKRYWATDQRTRNKLKRIVRSNGKEWAKAYAVQRRALVIYGEVVRRR